MGYWDATDNYLASHGGQGPTCTLCGKAMYPADDHGRFVCGCQGFRFFDVALDALTQTTQAPQVPENTNLNQKEKS